MVDDGDIEGERLTPPADALSRPAADYTREIDFAIAHGNLSLPSNFGRYEVLDRIGVGGFASVYSAFDPELESTVAIKVLAENHSANAAVRSARGGGSWCARSVLIRASIRRWSGSGAPPSSTRGSAASPRSSGWASSWAACD